MLRCLTNLLYINTNSVHMYIDYTHTDAREFTVHMYVYTHKQYLSCMQVNFIYLLRP